VVSLAARQGCARRACTPRLRLVATACSAAAVVSKQPPRGMEVVLFLSVMCMCLICLCLRVVDVWYLGLLLIDISWPSSAVYAAWGLSNEYCFRASRLSSLVALV